MTKFEQFAQKAKVRHDFSDQIQVRYVHPNGENFDTWVSGEEVLRRIKTAGREKWIQGFATASREESHNAFKQEVDDQKDKLTNRAKGWLDSAISDHLGTNIFANTLADKVTGRKPGQDPHDEEKQKWQTHLKDATFHREVLKLAWINLEGTFPPEKAEEPDDWM